MSAQPGMSEIEALALVVGGDKEPPRPAQRFQRTAKPAEAPGAALELGAQGGVHALKRLDLFFAQRDPLPTAFGLDPFGVGDLSINRLALSHRQGYAIPALLF